MQFEWDRAKAKRNLRGQRISFEEAVTVFYDPLSATFEDPDHSAGESRLITIGYSARGRLLTVVHAERGKTVRIISARRAAPGERKRQENKRHSHVRDQRSEYVFDYSKAVRGKYCRRLIHEGGNVVGA